MGDGFVIGFIDENRCCGELLLCLKTFIEQLIHHEILLLDCAIFCCFVVVAQGKGFSRGRGIATCFADAGKHGQVCSLRRQPAGQRKYSDQWALLLLPRPSA